MRRGLLLCPVASARLPQLINSATATRVANILGAGVTLESVGPWADTIRSDKAYAWASNLHFIDTPDWACKFTYVSVLRCARRRALPRVIYAHVHRAVGWGSPHPPAAALC